MKILTPPAQSFLSFCQSHRLQPYIIVGLTTIRKIFPFTLAAITLPQITSDIHLHPACTLFFTSFLCCLLLLTPGIYTLLLSLPLLLACSSFHLSSFSFTHISSLTSTDFHPSSHQCVCLPYQVLFHLRPIEHNVVCKHHSPQRPLADLICEPVHYHCKQGRGSEW